MSTWDAARRRLERATAALVALDFDGTLAPITEEPARATVPAAVLEALVTLARYVHVAVISGRPRSFLEQQLRPLVAIGATIVGNYGRSEAITEEERTRLSLAAERFEHLRAAGVVIERKPSSVVLHYRTRPDLADRAVELARTTAEEYGLVVQAARQAIEVLAPGAGSKGSVLEALLARSSFDFVLFAGDDLGDLEAVRAVRRSRVPSYCVAVASSELPAQLAAQCDEVVRQGTLHRRLRALATHLSTSRPPL